MISYRGLFNKSQEVLDFLNEIGLKEVAIKGRYSTYFKITCEMANAFESNNMDKYFKDVCNAKNSGFILKELYELVYVIENIKQLWVRSDKINQWGIYDRLRRIFYGPVYTELETPKNNQARNFQHELLFTARLINRGLINVSLHNNPDISVNSHGKEYAIECKRVIGNFRSAATTRVDEAIDQLYKVADKYFAGLVVLDVSQKYEEGKNWLYSTNGNTAEKYALDLLQEDVEWIYKNNKKLISSAKQGFVVGIFLSMSGVYALNTNELGWINEMGVLALNKENPFRAQTFIKDFQRLKPNPTSIL